MKEKVKAIKNNRFLNISVKILKAICTVLIVLIISIIVVQRFSNNKLSVGGVRLFTIITESMKPKYEIGDMIFATTNEPNSIKIGDDVVYEGVKGDFKGKTVTHQVIKINQKNSKYYFETKGLANNTSDPIISEDQVIGVVKYKSKILSFLSKILNNNFGFFFLIFVPLVVMIVLEIIDTVKDKGDKKNEEVI